MEHVKKWGPLGAAGFAGAALATMLTKDKGTVVRVGVGIGLTGLALFGAVRFGLAKA